MSITAALHDARAAEKEQAMFYRELAAQAEARGDRALAERLNDLHADEQHHLSRLTARLVELGEQVADLSATPVPAADLDQWEDAARTRERDEIARYEMLLSQELDAALREMITAFLNAERGHARELGGKWMDA
jgi:rubrerythrin